MEGFSDVAFAVFDTLAALADATPSFGVLANFGAWTARAAAPTDTPRIKHPMLTQRRKNFSNVKRLAPAGRVSAGLPFTKKEHGFLRL